MLEKSRIRISINEQGDLVLWVGELGESITENGANILISMIQGAKDDAKEVKTALKRIAGIRKPYNFVGRPLIPDNLKTIAGGADEAA